MSYYNIIAKYDDLGTDSSKNSNQASSVYLLVIEVELNSCEKDLHLASSYDHVEEEVQGQTKLTQSQSWGG